MPEQFLYYVPLIIQVSDRTGFHAKIVELNSPINSPEVVWDLINTLTEEYFPEGLPEEPGTMPVLPLGWTLISAKRGAGVKRGNGGRNAH